MALLCACGGDLAVKPQVLKPPASAAASEYFVEQVQVQSRDSGGGTGTRNEDYGRLLADALREGLRTRGRAVVAPPAPRVRGKVYLALGKLKDKVDGARGSGASVEVRLELVDDGSGATLYATHTVTAIPRKTFGIGPDPDEVVRQVLQAAADDFVSRL